MSQKHLLDFEGVKKILPQRYPFLMVDLVEAFEPKKRIHARKNVTANEPYFAGHFPEQAIMPGVLLLEALAQSAILLFALSNPGERWSATHNFYMAQSDIKFIKPVYPGDTLHLVVEAERLFTLAALVQCVATVDGEKVARAKLKFVVIEKNEQNQESVNLDLGESSGSILEKTKN